MLQFAGKLQLTTGSEKSPLTGGETSTVVGETSSEWAKRPGGETSWGRNVQGAKRPDGEMSWGKTSSEGAKRPGGLQIRYLRVAVWIVEVCSVRRQSDRCLTPLMIVQ